LQSILEEQYFLAKRAGITFSESTMMPDFERQMILAMLKRDCKKEAERFNQR
jgi:hypothetical protein